ncbi:MULTISPECIES: DUF3108 domain-containing protein [unclassified Rhizobacter]|uniref:DUF3108 domain-containing protein n=1 Tax=unclassified Rhizobacter TaxID=2640088 RepID=UPI0006F4E15E|nr:MULTISPECIES: DUF3108 domain-containing protein [unclassified Rhizobacter]KQU74839.1 hypothetical protein ASC88_25810 [Rhizobacter sp. Root29]KQW01086.1 hypothetical protein ASC98_07155 [Rhizobacter sp. Root1238]KRB03936.1 hypothetical protein ASE08_14660 [Rhizobacter sp. Root16D2]
MDARLTGRLRATPRRRAALLALVLGVLGVHGCVTRQLADRMGAFSVAPMPQRLQVAYVRELQPTVPVAVVPAPKPPPPKRMARAAAAAPALPSPVEPAASAVPVEPVPEPVPEIVATAEPEPAASAPAAAASAPLPEPSPVAVDSAASAPAAFEWPGSTRLSYVLTGNFRGHVDGEAQVEWIRDGNRYQVNVDVVIGLSFAPTASRRLTSEGQLTADGLYPTRYDQLTHVMLRDDQRVSMQLLPDAVVLANGQRRIRWPGVQDTASQFVQLTWLFTTQPQKLRTGESVEIPLALPFRVEPWTYDVLEEETLYTDFGEVPAFRVKPRRQPRGGDLIPEMWIAPSMRYLPLRIRIHQDADTWVDLMIRRKPELAAS